jgi:hypothetical protein
MSDARNDSGRQADAKAIPLEALDAGVKELLSFTYGDDSPREAVAAIVAAVMGSIAAARKSIDQDVPEQP